MVDKTVLRVKIKISDNRTAERENIASQPAEKRLRDIADYEDVGWRVLGVPFGGPVEGRDLDGEAFTADTDIWLKIGDEVNLTYYHGFGPDDPEGQQNPPVVIGRARYSGPDARGHWFDVYLDGAEQLAQRLLRAGVENVRASSGAVNHLVRTDDSGLIAVWPVGEIALFDVNLWRQPANDYAVVETKSETISEASPEAEKSAEVAAEVEDKEQNKLKKTNIKTKKENKKMDEEEIVAEETPEAEESQIDVRAEIKAAVDAMRKSVVEELKSAPGTEKGKPTLKAPGLIDGLGEKSYKDSFWHYVRTGETSDIRRASKAALQEGTTTEGGYLVPDDEYGSIIAKRDEESIVSRLGLLRVSTNRDKYNFPVEDTSEAKFSLIAEEGAISAAEDEPTFAQKQVSVYKFTKLIKVSVELLEDENQGLEAFLTGAFGRALADTENYYTLIGAGTTEPKGAFVGGTAGLTFDSATAIAPAEIPELMGKLPAPYHNGAAFVMDPATWFYLKGLSGNPFVFTAGQGRLSGTVDGPTLEGYPVVLNSNVANIAASAKSVLFGNLNFMGFVTNRGLRIQRLTELYAGNGQVGILATYRFGCDVLQAEALQYATQAAV